MKLLWLVEMWSNISVLKYVLASVCVTYVWLCFDVRRKDASSLFNFKSASVYAIREVAPKQEVLEFNASKSVVGVALIYSHHKFVLEAKKA